VSCFRDCLFSQVFETYIPSPCVPFTLKARGFIIGIPSTELPKTTNDVDVLPIGPFRRAFFTWISEFTTGCLLMSVRHVRQKLAFNPETSKKE
jgi:hypothetical protein